MLWVKALHVIAVIAWMAALLYLPRLFVYHADSAAGSDKSETFKVMERRLFYGIATPAMAGAWVFGLWLVWLVRAWEEHWFLAKLACVVALTLYQACCALDAGLRRRSQPAPRAVLPARERGSHNPAHRDRDSGDREAVLMK